MKKMMSTKEAAEYFGVTPFTIREWCKDGTLKAVKPPGTKSWRIPRESVEKLVQTKYGS